jgi:two-component system, cell cycle response regulator DivK
MAKILVVDDNADERLIYSAVLHYHGHEVEEAADARSGIDLAKTRMPNIILMDVHLPVMNGLLATEVLRATPETADIPVVCVTGYDLNPANAFAAGCSQFLRKPISPGDLVNTVNTLLAHPPAR